MRRAEGGGRSRQARGSAKSTVLWGKRSRDQTSGNWHPLMGRDFRFRFTNHRPCGPGPELGKVRGLTIPRDGLSAPWTPPAGCGPGRRTRRRKSLAPQDAGPGQRPEEGVKPKPMPEERPRPLKGTGPRHPLRFSACTLSGASQPCDDACAPRSATPAASPPRLRSRGSPASSPASGGGRWRPLTRAGCLVAPPVGSFPAGGAPA